MAQLPTRGPTRGPSATEILEFVRKSNIIDLKVPLGTLLEHTAMLEGSINDAARKGGWVIVSDGWVLVTGGSEIVQQGIQE